MIKTLEKVGMLPIIIYNNQPKICLWSQKDKSGDVSSFCTHFLDLFLIYVHKQTFT
jgi:hypothetical protein